MDACKVCHYRSGLAIWPEVDVLSRQRVLSCHRLESARLQLDVLITLIPKYLPLANGLYDSFHPRQVSTCKWILGISILGKDLGEKVKVFRVQSDAVQG